MMIIYIIFKMILNQPMETLVFFNGFVWTLVATDLSCSRRSHCGGKRDTDTDSIWTPRGAVLSGFPP